MKKLSEYIEERRDPVKIGERDFDKAVNKGKRRTKKAFKDVFGYSPDLGEPTWVEEGNRKVPGWYVYGFIFKSHDNHLFVRNVNNTWESVSRPWVFRKKVLSGQVVREPLDGYNDEHE